MLTHVLQILDRGRRGTVLASPSRRHEASIPATAAKVHVPPKGSKQPNLGHRSVLSQPRGACTDRGKCGTHPVTDVNSARGYHVQTQHMGRWLPAPLLPGAHTCATNFG